ncbi:ChbG/HpnK family deacetylase, partial [bacterium]|nr:ChbG/HpnK family deacetylase [bacterium]
VRAHREGVLTSTSLMIGEPAAEEAIALARETPSLKVGLHLVLADGFASARHASELAMIDEQGKLAADPVAAGMRYFLERVRLSRAIRAEVLAQLERFRASGLALHHVDGHLNVHLHPQVLAPLLELLPRFGSPEVRVPREPLSRALSVKVRPLAYKVSHAVIFSTLGAWARPKLVRAGLPVADRVLGLFSTFDPPCEETLLALLPAARGRTELYLHPGAREPEEDTELAALLSPRVASRIRELGIRLDRASS